LIDEAATEIFAERGYEAATMQEIARAAGVVASVIYDHYPSKRKLYVELLEQHGRTLVEKTIRAPSEADFRGELRAQIDDFFRTIEEDPFVWRMLFRDPPGDADTAAAHARVQARATEAIASVLESAPAGARAGGTSESGSATMVAEMVKSSLNGLAAWWWEHREIPREELVATATALLWDGLSQVSTMASGC
jgi:AcrR family transcriptional regulator